MQKRGGVILFFFAFLVVSLGFVIADHERGHPPEGFGDFEDRRDDFRDRGGFDGGFPPECAAVDCLQGFHCVTGGACVPDEENGIEKDVDEEKAEELDVEKLIEEAEGFDEELEVSAGITPDSPFYRIDEFFDRFSSPLKLREERIAEMRELAEECNAGNQDACQFLRKAFEKYKEHAEEFEKEVTPEELAEAQRSSKAIRKAITDIAQNVPPGEKDEYIREIVKREKNIETASEIASKINELCRALADLDPKKFEQTCKTSDDGPRWQRDLFEGLSSDQEEEAREFFKIMTQCIETSGRECRCDEISITAFADKCAVIAPLEAICDDESIPEEEAEAACDEVDELTEDIEDLLPDYLIDVLDEVIEGFEDDEFENHGIPEECKDAGITGRESDARERCMKIMILESDEIPRECRSALADALEAGVTSEREFDRICSTIMFREHAPQECIERGITDPRECADLFEREFDRSGPGQDYGRDCSRITISEERLACYDGALGDHDGGGSFEERYRETKEAERQCADSCHAQGGAWDFSGGYCECRIDDYYYEDDNYYDDDYYDGGGPEEDYKDDFDSGSYDCAFLDCQPGFYCDPYQGCVSDGGFDDGSGTGGDETPVGGDEPPAGEGGDETPATGSGEGGDSTDVSSSPPR